VHVNSRDNNFLRCLSVAAAALATFVVFGVSGAQAASTQALVASGSLVAEEHDTSDEDPSDEDSTDEDEATDDPEEDSEDSDDEDSDDEDSESDEPTEERTDEPTFTEPSPTDPTDGVTEMPTDEAGTTSEAGASPLGWILLAGGLASAVAAFFVYRRSRHIM
jgi:hypothetical protein